LATSLRHAVARRSAQIRQREHDLSALQAIERIELWEATSVILGVIMADSSHHSINSPTVRAHVSAARERGLIEEPLAARDEFTSQLHCLPDGRRLSLAFHPTVGHQRRHSRSLQSPRED